MEIPRNPVPLTVSRMLELNQHFVLAIYNTTLSSYCEIGWTFYMDLKSCTIYFRSAETQII